MNMKMEVLSKVVDVQVPMAFLGAKLLALDWLPLNFLSQKNCSLLYLSH